MRYVKQQEAVPVLYDEGVGPTDGFTRGRSLKGFPNALAGLHLQATQLPVTADAVNEAVFKERRAHDGVEVGGVLLVALERAPGGGCRGLVGVEPQHQGATVKGGEEEVVAQLARRGEGHPGAGLDRK